GPEADVLPEMNGKVDTLRIWKGRSILYPFILFKKISRIRPHIVHVQFGPHGNVYGGMFGEPMVFLLLLLKAIGIKTTMTLHSTWMTKQVVDRISTYKGIGRFAFLASAVFRIYMKFLGAGTTKIQLSTVKKNSDLRKQFLSEYKYNERNVDEIPFPCGEVHTRIEPLEAKKELGILANRIILLFGYIRRGKGFEIAQRAMKYVKEAMPNALLLIAGKPLDEDGYEYLMELQEQREEMNLKEAIRYDTEFIPLDKVPHYIGASDILLIPYTESVGASAPIHNLAGYGIAVVASDIGYHMKESLGGSLTLFRSGDYEDLANKLILLLQNDNLRKKRGSEHLAYAKIETWELAAKRTLAHYSSLE
ncbi:MAG: glycosyltransferase, partial [Candidatus Thorarchaeota archaeon]|nr:glycosyltransferase [Candidatus Thorarchaeota archaeon]